MREAIISIDYTAQTVTINETVLKRPSRISPSQWLREWEELKRVAEHRAKITLTWAMD
jgi:hypothetical protein